MAPTVSPSVPIASDDRFASAIVAGGASGFHVLRIEGYSGTKFTIPNGQDVESRPFQIAGHTWTISYYPNGDCPGNADYISLFLVLKETVAKPLLVQLVFSFMDQVEKQRPSYVREANKFISYGSWGRDKFVKRTELEQSERLRDDCFTVRCDIIVLSEPRAEAAGIPASSFVTVPPPDWSEHFRALLLGGKGADVRFLVGGETIAAHRCVLAARSPVFDAMLLGPMKEGTTTQNQIQSCIPVTIDGMVPQVFRSLLHFIYTDSLPPGTEGQGNTEDGASATMSQHLLEAADRYGMQRLKLICEDRLCRHIDVTTVATTLVLADQHGCRGLKEACHEFLKSSKTLDAVMATDGFQHLVKSCPSALFELMSKLASH